MNKSPKNNEHNNNHPVHGRVLLTTIIKTIIVRFKQEKLYYVIFIMVFLLFIPCFNQFYQDIPNAEFGVQYEKDLLYSVTDKITKVTNNSFNYNFENETFSGLNFIPECVLNLDESNLIGNMTLIEPYNSFYMQDLFTTNSFHKLIDVNPYNLTFISQNNENYLNLNLSSKSEAEYFRYFRINPIVFENVTIEFQTRLIYINNSNKINFAVISNEGPFEGPHLGIENASEKIKFQINASSINYLLLYVPANTIVNLDLFYIKILNYPIRLYDGLINNHLIPMNKLILIPIAGTLLFHQLDINFETEIILKLNFFYTLVQKAEEYYFNFENNNLAIKFQFNLNLEIRDILVLKNLKLNITIENNSIPYDIVGINLNNSVIYTPNNDVYNEIDSNFLSVFDSFLNNKLSPFMIEFTIKIKFDFLTTVHLIIGSRKAIYTIMVVIISELLLFFLIIKKFFFLSKKKDQES